MSNTAKIGLAIVILIIFVGIISWWATHRNTPKSTKTGNLSVKKQVNIYVNRDIPLQFRYPPKFHTAHRDVADTSGWSYSDIHKGDLLIQLKLDSTVQSKTNLSEATFTVGRNDNANILKDCMKKPEGFMLQSKDVEKDGKEFSRSKYSDAGAGNYYTVVQYRTIRNNYCYSIEEMVHSTNIHNYPPERGISSFDSAKVWGKLDDMWQSLHFK
jgi:hypothetical protein